MSKQDRAREQCNAILRSVVGPNAVDGWWNMSNRQFDLKTPNEVWYKGDWQTVHNYLLRQLNGDYY